MLCKHVAPEKLSYFVLEYFIGIMRTRRYSPRANLSRTETKICEFRSLKNGNRVITFCLYPSTPCAIDAKTTRIYTSKGEREIKCLLLL